jgi:hypothetical protein
MSSNPQSEKKTNVYFNISSSNPNVLEGLEKWLQLGLFSEKEIREIAQNYLKCDTYYDINHLISKPNLLAGLEIGLSLGLFSEQEIKQIAQTKLVCPCDYSSRKTITTPIPQPIEKTVIQLPPPPKQPSFVASLLRAFKDELSVRWLLFLGVFLVILSSGVLAASQWDKFPASGQYGVLLSYTLVFWGVGFYAAKQENLKLTAQTLQTITLLLTPVNFWAIDTFGLWNNFLGGLIATIAVFLLTGITIISNGEKTYLPLVINFFGLSLLHLGWQIVGFPLIAVYFSMIGTAINLRFILPRQFSSTLGHKPLTLIKTSFVSYGLAILLVRAIFVVNISVPKLGLAIAICGWLLTLEALGKNGLIFQKNKEKKKQNKLQSPVNQGLEITGAILMLIGWLVTVNNIPTQAILISSLALHWLSQRLTTYWLKKDLFWIFIIGLQALVLIRNLIPDNFKQNALNLSIEIAQSQQYPYTVYGLTLFPYLLFFVWLTGLLYHKDKKQLARFGEYLILSLGICLTIISCFNPTWRSLNLILSTFTLIYLNFRYQNQIVSLIYFNHLIALFTLSSCFDWLLSGLNLVINIRYWGRFFLIVMLFELTLSVLPFHILKFKEKEIKSAKIWFNSCWHFGLVCLGLAYSLLIQQFSQDFSQLSVKISLDQWLSFLIPLTLTGVAFATKNKHKRQEKAAWISLFFLLLIQLITIWNPLLRVINLIFTTGLIFINSRFVSQDKDIQTPLIYSNHIVGLTTIIVTINYLLPNLHNLQWNFIYLSLMVIEWIVSIFRFERQDQENPQTPTKKSELLFVWYQSSWHLGFIFAIISYLLFFYSFNLDINKNWFLLWSLTPLTLTFIASQSPSQERKNASIYSAISLVFLALLNLWFPPTRIISLSLAMGLMLINTRYHPNLAFTNLHFGFGITLIISLGWDYLISSQWFILGASLSLTLWILQGIFQQNQGSLALLYSKSAQNWALVISNLTLLALSYRYFFEINYSFNYFFSGLVLLIAFIYNAKNNPVDAIIYRIGWVAELILVEEIGLFNPTTMNIATGNIILSLITLIFSYRLASKFPRFSQLSSWQILPFLYAIIGLFFRLQLFNPYTGLLVIGASITGIGVSIRQKKWKWLTYLSIAGISFGCYEQVTYQLLQKSEGSPADGLTILALVTVAIALFYRLFVWVWHLKGKDHFLNFSLTELTLIAHFHWGLGSILKIITAGIALETAPKLTYLSLGISFFLGAYALIQARDEHPDQQSSQSDWWVYVGLVEIVATCVYARLIFTNLSMLDPLQVIIASLVALFIYQIPWHNLGWKATPWHRFALITPALMALTNSNNITSLSLIFVAIFYARIAVRQKNLRWTYLSLGFLDWAIFIFFNQYVLTDPLWFISIISLSILYIAQFDPELITPKYRQNRHNLRILGSALMGVSALILHTQLWLIPATISLGFLLIGLGFQIRAFLYVGTILFMLTNFYQLVVLISEASLSKWIIGFITGIFLILIAALFERKKETIFITIQNWFEQLQQWD